MVTANDIVNLFETADIRLPVAPLLEDVALVLQGLDSLDMATLILAVETRYGIVVPTDRVGRLRTLRDFADLLNSAGSPLAAAP